MNVTMLGKYYYQRLKGMKYDVNDNLLTFLESLAIVFFENIQN